MFGYKLIKESELTELKTQLQNLNDCNESKIDLITSLENELNTLKDKLAEIEKSNESSKSDVVLLTDVAETPLVEEKKIRKRTTKKTSSAQTKSRKVVRKVDTTE